MVIGKSACRFLVNPISKGLIRVLSEEQSFSTLMLSAYLAIKQRWEGPHYHRVVGKWLDSGLSAEKDLLAWLKDTFRPSSVSSSKLDKAAHQANRSRDDGVWVATWKAEGPPALSHSVCPSILFGIGNGLWNQPWLSVFNSRKPRLISQQAEWLLVLRSAMPAIASEKLGISSSLGTLTYDLVSAYSQFAKSPLMLVLPHAIEDIIAGRNTPLLSEGLSPTLTLSCCSKALTCSKARRQQCRDRLLAFLSDIHLVIAIQSTGNLMSTLQRQQSSWPRFQSIYSPQKIQLETRGNLELLAEFPKWVHSFSFSDLKQNIEPLEHNHFPIHSPPSHGSHAKGSLVSAPPIVWGEYLYHYTRACPGPWPGQLYRDFLMRLMENDPLSSHTALDTLIHILIDGRIRASSKLMRGGYKTVSLSSLPPIELKRIRRWNSALIRWTFEPYGVAISRKLLKRLGAKPAIYSPKEAYSRLKALDRFRYQRHEPPCCAWKQEREWRLPRDFEFHELAATEGLLFVDTADDAQRIGKLVESPLQIFTLQRRTEDH